MRRLLTGLAAGLAAACAIGPSYHRPDLGVPDAWHPPSATADSLRPFYDSLRSTGESTLSQPTVSPDSVANLDWFDLLRDPELRKLVETALQQNRDVRMAIASIDEFRAQYGVTRGALFPQLSVNGEGGTEKSVFGSLGAFKFDVVTATADLQWELDFWGRLRRASVATVGGPAAAGDRGGAGGPAGSRGEPAGGGADAGERRCDRLPRAAGAGPGSGDLEAHARVQRRDAAARAAPVRPGAHLGAGRAPVRVRGGEPRGEGSGLRAADRPEGKPAQRAGGPEPGTDSPGERAERDAGAARHPRGVAGLADRSPAGRAAGGAAAARGNGPDRRRPRRAAAEDHPDRRVRDPEPGLLEPVQELDRDLPALR